MVGKGSVNHNSRKFHAKNTDPERSSLNVEYCNQNIKDVYHELFDAALSRYNEKQKRRDRRIDDYYEKILAGKQEKPFHEIILQVGNKDNMNAKEKEGMLAAKVLEEYMAEFQQRNSTLRIFSAHLHMDEATPHLHIDFVPFTTGSKRGLDTRVSLKQHWQNLDLREAQEVTQNGISGFPLKRNRLQLLWNVMVLSGRKRERMKNICLF